MRAKDTGFDAGKGRFTSEKRVGWTKIAGCLLVLGAAAFVAGESPVPQYSGGLPGIERNAGGMPDSANPRQDDAQAMRDWQRHLENVKRAKALNVERQKEMNVETGKLLTLANEVEAETDKRSSEEAGSGHKDAVSVADLRKVEMIEKLARSVREKMTATITVE